MTLVIDDSHPRKCRVNDGPLIIAEFFGEHALQHARRFVAAHELLECLSDAVDRMFGSSPAIAQLRERSLAAIAKANAAAGDAP